MNAYIYEKASSTTMRDSAVCASHLVVAVPDHCIEEMLLMALELRGYRVTCTPIDLLHPMAWLFKAMRARPDAVIVDIDLFRFCSVPQSILAIQQFWPQSRLTPTPGWIWLSRRPIERTAALRMPFRLADLFATLEGQNRQGSILSSEQSYKKLNGNRVSL